MAKKGNKKGEGDEEKKIREYLMYEIEKLENLIYFEQEKEISATRELEKIIERQNEEQKSIESLTLDESKKINTENENMKGIINSFTLQINNLEKEISDFDEDIKIKRIEIADLEKKNAEEIQKKNKAIEEQRETLDKMSTRFQLILQKTANKLQDRVDMGK